MLRHHKKSKQKIPLNPPFPKGEGVALWQLYLLRCVDGSLYTGITKNLEKRLQQHNQGRASKYTRSRLPVKLVYQESCAGHGQALTRESEIKAYSKIRKEELANS